VFAIGLLSIIKSKGYMMIAETLQKNGIKKLSQPIDKYIRSQAGGHVMGATVVADIASAAELYIILFLRN
jgi:hypothetical protein